MARVSEFVAESFENSIGQTLNPGDDVVAVTTGYSHRVSTFTGKFEGVYKNAKGEIVGSRVGSIPVVWTTRDYTEDGEHEETRYVYVYNHDARRYDYIPTGKRYNLVKNTRYRKSSLQLNRVYKIDTTLSKAKI